MVTTSAFLTAWLQAKFRSERGASLVEYAFLLTLIAVICIVALSFLGNEASKSFKETGDSLAVN